MFTKGRAGSTKRIRGEPMRGSRLIVRANGVSRDWTAKVARLVLNCYSCSLRRWNVPDYAQVTVIHYGTRAGVAVVNESGRSCCVKLFHDHRIHIKLRNLLGFSKARRAFRNGCELQRRGISVPVMRGWAVDVRSGMALLMTEMIQDANRVDLWIKDNELTYGLIEGLADFIRKMHDAGVGHSDLSLRNILVDRRDGRFYFWIMDYEDAVFSASVSRRQRIRELHHICERALGLTTLRQRIFFLKCYLKDRSRLKGWARELDRYMRRHPSKYTQAGL